MPTREELLEGPLLKLSRAEHHIRDLTARIDGFLARRPYQLIAEVRCDPDEIALRTKTLQAIPTVFSAIIGDAIHNLRSALDLLLFGMAEGHTTKPEKIQFPFPKTESGLGEAIKNGQGDFAGTKVVDAIHTLKPYPTGNKVLSGIHTLNIRDKHRLLILSRSIAMFITGDDFSKYFGMFVRLDQLPFPIPKGVPWRFINSDDSDLFKVPLVGGEPWRTYVNMYQTKGREIPIQPTFSIVFGEGCEPFRNSSVIDTLLEAKKEVSNAIDLLTNAFFDSSNVVP